MQRLSPALYWPRPMHIQSCPSWKLLASVPSFPPRNFRGHVLSKECPRSLASRHVSRHAAQSRNSIRSVFVDFDTADFRFGQLCVFQFAHSCTYSHFVRAEICNLDVLWILDAELPVDAADIARNYGHIRLHFERGRFHLVVALGVFLVRRRFRLQRFLERASFFQQLLRLAFRDLAILQVGTNFSDTFLAEFAGCFFVKATLFFCLTIEDCLFFARYPVAFSLSSALLSPVPLAHRGGQRPFDFFDAI